MEFFDRCFHIPVPIVKKHKLGLPFLPRNLPIKFGTNPSTIFLVIVVALRVKWCCVTVAAHLPKTLAYADCCPNLQGQLL